MEWYPMWLARQRTVRLQEIKKRWVESVVPNIIIDKKLNEKCGKWPTLDQLTFNIKLKKTISVILIAGGENSWGGQRFNSEGYDPSQNQTIWFGELQTARIGSTFCNNFLCGNKDSDRSCEKPYWKNFELLPVRLLEPRGFHLCWGLESGEVMLLGGENSPTTSEVVSADGTSSSQSFGLIAQTS